MLRGVTAVPEPLIEACGLGAGYRGRAVLKDIGVALRPGERVALVGPNGAGKSTLVRALAGTLLPSAGSVLLEGRPLGAWTRREIARRIAVVPQESDVAFAFTAREVVAMGRAPHQSGLLRESAEDRRQVDAALQRCDLGALEARRLDELSGGERRLVALARALAQRSRILLLDEPAAHLDLRHAARVHAIAREEAHERRVAVLSVMHDLNAAARWAERIVVVCEGRVRADGSPATALDAALLSEVFGVSLRAHTDPTNGSRWLDA
jgi:iron complex transport system ATP-binding protein